jgi:hypothetical protein
MKMTEQIFAFDTKNNSFLTELCSSRGIIKQKQHFITNITAQTLIYKSKSTLPFHQLIIAVC